MTLNVIQDLSSDNRFIVIMR